MNQNTESGRGKRKPDTPQRRKALQQFIEEYGLYNLHVGQFARQWGVSEETIYKDRQLILQHIDIIDAETTKFELQRAYKKVMKDAWKHWNNEMLSHRERQKYGEILLKCMNEQTKFLEDWGAKTITNPFKGAENTIVTFQHIQQAFQEAQRGTSHGEDETNT